MNLHTIVSGVIGAVNPFQFISVQVSTGNATNPDGTRTPQYITATNVSAQVQELSSADLRQLDSLNIQGATRMMYLDGRLDGVVRVTDKGGDLVTLRDGTLWLTTQVVERWDEGWCKIGLTLQNGA